MLGVGARRPPLMRRAPPRRESAPYFVGPRCVFVCVCVCLCVYSRVGASYVGRPICVCAVSAPLRRVNNIHTIHRCFLTLRGRQTTSQIREIRSEIAAAAADAAGGGEGGGGGKQGAAAALAAEMEGLARARRDVTQRSAVSSADRAESLGL